MTSISAKNKFIVGSTCFFNGLNGFASKDIDELWIVDEWHLNGKSFLLKTNKMDIILYPSQSKEEFIENDLENGDMIKLGKYLSPKFISYIGMEMDDLKKLKPLYDKLDAKHSYQKVIFDSYIENNGFYLTDGQLSKAYEIYKKCRKK